MTVSPPEGLDFNSLVEAPTPDQRRPTQRGFRLHLVTALVVLGYLTWIMGYPLAAGLETSAYESGRRMGTFLSSLLIGGVFAAIAWLLAKRSSWAGNVVLCVVVMLHATGTVLSDLRKTANQRSAQTVAKINALAREAGERVEAQIPSEAVPDTLGDFQSRVSGLESAFEGASGDDARTGKAVTTFLRELEPAVAEYDRAFKAVMANGGIDASTIDSLETLDARVRLFEGFRDANERLFDGYSKMPTRVAEIMLAQGLTHSEAQRQARSITGHRNFELQRAIRESDRDIAEASLAMLAVLRTAWGAWSYDKTSDGLTFEDESQIEPYDTALQKLQKASDLQVSLAQQLADSLKRAGGS